MAWPDTIYGMFLEAADRYRKPDALASKVGGAWEPISHDRLRERVRNIALAFHALGVRRGDRIALMCESRPEWPIVDLAALGCGAALVPIYVTLTPEHVEHILADSGARVCVVSSAKHLDRVLALLPSLPDLERVVVIDRAEWAADAPVSTLADLEVMGADRHRAEPELAERLASEGTRDDLVTLIYTSGTTGKQKGVVLTHGNIMSNITASFDETRLFSSSDVALSFLPQSHILERTAIYGFLHSGVSVYFAQSIDSVASDMREVRPTVMTSVPRLFEKMYSKFCEAGAGSGGLKAKIFKRALRAADRVARATQAGESGGLLLRLEHRLADRIVFEKFRERLGGRVRCFISGGAPLAADIAYVFLGAGVTIFEGYGLTETSPVIAVNHPEAYRIGTVGKPLANLDVRLDTDGEILVRGPSVMSGYYNLPDATAEAFTDDGYFRTGDIGAFDGDGFLKITDRKKDLLKTSGGKYIAPQPIENAIKASTLVSQVVVLGDRRKFCAALIVPNFDALIVECAKMRIEAADRAILVRDARVVKLYLETVTRLTPDLAQYETIKKVALLPRELTIEAGEMTPTLKIKRRVVEQRFKDLIDAIYDESAERETAAHG
jgi:long-chain acyl-CoA synthetase